MNLCKQDMRSSKLHSHIEDDCDPCFKIDTYAGKRVNFYTPTSAQFTEMVLSVMGHHILPYKPIRNLSPLMYLCPPDSFSSCTNPELKCNPLCLLFPEFNMFYSLLSVRLPCNELKCFWQWRMIIRCTLGSNRFSEGLFCLFGEELILWAQLKVIIRSRWSACTNEFSLWPDLTFGWGFEESLGSPDCEGREAC